MGLSRSAKSMSLLLVAAASIYLTAGNAVAAQIFNFDYSGSTYQGNGTFTTNGIGSPYQLSGITGTANGKAISGLSPYASSDNTLFYPSTGLGHYVDYAGISFTTVGGPAFNIFFDPVAGKYGVGDSVNYSGNIPTNSSTIVNFSVSQVPEPTSIALFGLGMLGFAVSRRKSAK